MVFAVLARFNNEYEFWSLLATVHGKLIFFDYW